MRQIICLPSREVKALVLKLKELSKSHWIHFHCAAGSGRTTTFMCLLDMVLNSQQLSFEDILLRQHLLGGADLANLGDPSDWKYPYAIERLELLRNFYKEAKRT